jgi:DNA-binding XRE family transcriptional regulator
MDSMSNQGSALCQKAAGSYGKFSRIAVRSSGTLGKGRKPRFTVYGGFLSRLYFFTSLITSFLYKVYFTVESQEDQPLTLAKLRERVNLTQMKLAVAIGVSLTTVSEWENGKSEPRLKYVRRLVEVLGCSFEELCEAFDQIKRRK